MKRRQDGHSKMPDTGYAVARSRDGKYLKYFILKSSAERAAKKLADSSHERVDLVRIQNRGDDRFIVGEFEPKSWRR